jgi:hypothetical protein
VQVFSRESNDEWATQVSNRQARAGASHLQAALVKTMSSPEYLYIAYIH